MSGILSQPNAAAAFEPGAQPNTCPFCARGLVPVKGYHYLVNGEFELCENSPAFREYQAKVDSEIRCRCAVETPEETLRIDELQRWRERYNEALAERDAARAETKKAHGLLDSIDHWDEMSGNFGDRAYWHRRIAGYLGRRPLYQGEDPDKGYRSVVSERDQARAELVEIKNTLRKMLGVTL